MKLLILKSINRYFNYVFYPFFIITALFIFTLIFSQSTLYVTYSSTEENYRNIIDFYTFCFAVVLLLKYFLQEVEEHKGNFTTILKNSIPFIIINLIFFTLFFINNSLEDKILTQIKNVEQYSVPLHIILYAISLYFIYSNYQSAHAEFTKIKIHESYTEIFLDIIEATEESVIQFLILCIGLFFAGKIDLLIYLIHNINTTFIFIGITSALVFLVLYIIHKMKKQKK